MYIAFAAAHHQHTNQIPAPMTLLDSTQYNQNYQETIVLSHNTLPHQYCRSQSHPSSNEMFVGDPKEYIQNNQFMQRPYSFTDGEVKDFVEIQGEITCSETQNLYFYEIKNSFVPFINRLKYQKIVHILDISNLDICCKMKLLYFIYRFTLIYDIKIN